MDTKGALKKPCPLMFDVLLLYQHHSAYFTNGGPIKDVC